MGAANGKSTRAFHYATFQKSGMTGYRPTIGKHLPESRRNRFVGDPLEPRGREAGSKRGERQHEIGKFEGKERQK